MEPVKRVTVKASKYHGKDGFTITHSNGPGQWPGHIFTRTREGAEAIRLALKKGDTAKSDAVVNAILLAGL